MPTPIAFPTGTFPIIVNNDLANGLNGPLILSVVNGVNKGTFKGANNDVSASLTWNSTTGVIGWSYTDKDSYVHNFTGGLYAAGPPKSFSGGQVNVPNGAAGDPEEPWAATSN
jgi:hypothetical protein